MIINEVICKPYSTGKFTFVLHQYRAVCYSYLIVDISFILYLN